MTGDSYLGELEKIGEAETVEQLEALAAKYKEQFAHDESLPDLLHVLYMTMGVRKASKQ